MVQKVGDGTDGHWQRLARLGDVTLLRDAPKREWRRDLVELSRFGASLGHVTSLRHATRCQWPSVPSSLSELLRFPKLTNFV